MRAIATAAALCALTAAPALAADFSYSFEAKNDVSGKIGTVSGVIYGLADQGTSPAKSFSFKAPNFSGELTTIYPSEFTVLNNQITDFSARGVGYEGFYDFYVILNFRDTTFASRSNPRAYFEAWHATGKPSDLNFQRIDSAVPEPATWAMMIAGFSAIGLTLRRRQARSAARPV